MPKSTTQEQFAKLVGITQPAVSQLVRKGILTRGGNVNQWFQEYLRNLREQAAGHSPTNNQRDLMGARAELALEQKKHYEIQNAKRLNELIPLEPIAKVFEQIFSDVRRKLLVLSRKFRSQWPEIPLLAVDGLDSLVNEILEDLYNARLPRDIRKQIQKIEQHLLHFQAPTPDDGKPVGGHVSKAKSRKQR